MVCRPLAWGLVVSFLLAGCGSPAHLQRVVPFSRQDPNATIVILPPEVALRERGLAADPAPRGDWNDQARQHIADLAAAILQQRKVAVELLPTGDGEAAAASHVLAQHREAARSLAGQPSFTSGRGFVVGATRFGIDQQAAAALRAHSAARYALLLSLSDTYSSTGRIVGQVAVGVALVAAFVVLGMPPPLVAMPGLSGDGGAGAAPGAGRAGAASAQGQCPEQTGHASMIELATGDVVWFNRVAGGCSDLRDPEDVRRTLELLLTGFP